MRTWSICPKMFFPYKYFQSLTSLTSQCLQTREKKGHFTLKQSSIAGKRLDEELAESCNSRTRRKSDVILFGLSFQTV